MNGNDVLWLANFVCGLILLPFLPVIALAVFAIDMLVTGDLGYAACGPVDLWRAWVDLFWEG